MTLHIDGNQFRLGELEPVSQLRYVYANQRVYLQPDFIIPLLQSGSSAFTDLQVTGNVLKVSIDKNTINETRHWDNLKAIAILKRPAPEISPIATIKITESPDTTRSFALYAETNGVILVEEKQEFGYLLANQQTSELGLGSQTKIVD